ncbi:hypothetical protein FACS1894202_12740 [Clostridia bacterium]|nr:hypothetical protein FACS1894202_12740 [Clostridia bacterium]
MDSNGLKELRKATRADGNTLHIVQQLNTEYTPFVICWHFDGKTWDWGTYCQTLEQAERVFNEKAAEHDFSVERQANSNTIWDLRDHTREVAGAINKAIAGNHNYGTHIFGSEATAKEVFDKYPLEEVAAVVACYLKFARSDGRIHTQNKLWAEDYVNALYLSDSENSKAYWNESANAPVALLSPHMTLVDSFANRVREELARVQSPVYVGRIDFLGGDGEVGESIEYTDTEKFLADIKRENYYGAPMTITLYYDEDGQTIPRDFMAELDPPVSVYIEEHDERGNEDEEELEW